jgi:hypothetical protein
VNFTAHTHSFHRSRQLLHFGPLDISEENQRQMNLFRARPRHGLGSKAACQIAGRLGQPMRDLYRRKNREKQPHCFTGSHKLECVSRYFAN